MALYFIIGKSSRLRMHSWLLILNAPWLSDVQSQIRQLYLIFQLYPHFSISTFLLQLFM